LHCAPIQVAGSGTSSTQGCPAVPLVPADSHCPLRVCAVHTRMCRFGMNQALQFCNCTGYPAGPAAGAGAVLCTRCTSAGSMHARGTCMLAAATVQILECNCIASHACWSALWSAPSAPKFSPSALVVEPKHTWFEHVALRTTRAHGLVGLEGLVLEVADAWW
jgi:hypothetical protein